MFERVDIDPQIEEILDKSMKTTISTDEAIKLIQTTGNEFHALLMTADQLRADIIGERYSTPIPFTLSIYRYMIGLGSVEIIHTM